MSSPAIIRLAGPARALQLLVGLLCLFGAGISLAHPQAAHAGALPRLQQKTDITYKMAGIYPLTLDVVRPERRGTGRPMVIFVHGGGWWNGDKTDLRTRRHTMQAFARRGFVTASINYRLACGTAQLPRVWMGHDLTRNYRLCGPYGIADQVEDIQASVRYLRGHAQQMGADPSRIGLFGVSAGGHLSLLAAASARPSERVRAVANWGGPPTTSFIATQNPRNYGSIVASFSNAAGCYLHDSADCAAVWRQVTPMSVITKRTPRFAVQGLAAEGERQVPPAAHMAFRQYLRGMGWHAEALVVPHGCHGAGCDHFKVTRGDRSGFIAIGAALNFFRQYTAVPLQR